MKTINQRQKILKYLQSHRAMSTLQARAELDIMHPSARVQELKVNSNQPYKNNNDSSLFAEICMNFDACMRPKS